MIIKLNLIGISTHAPHARRGLRGGVLRNRPKRFLLTRLMRGAAGEQTSGKQTSGISTHAPHARRGLFPRLKATPGPISTHAPHARRGSGSSGFSCKSTNFYSRASCEARHFCDWDIFRPKRFLLTRLMRGAARAGCRPAAIKTISTHAPHARRGKHHPTTDKRTDNFYSRASCEARQEKVFDMLRGQNFYSRASCEARHGRHAAKGKAT